MSANDKLAATFGPGRTTPTPTLETRIAEILAQHVAKRPWSDSGVMKCSCGERFVAEYDYQQRALHQAHQAAVLAPVIREREAEASAQAFQAVRDNAEYEPEERDGPNLIIAAYLMIDVDKLNALDKSHDGMDWVRYTATDYANAITDAKVEALREAADKFQRGDWFNVIDGNAHVKIGNGQRVTDWLRARADNLGKP